MNYLSKQLLFLLSCLLMFGCSLQQQKAPARVSSPVKKILVVEKKAIKTNRIKIKQKPSPMEVERQYLNNLFEQSKLLLAILPVKSLHDLSWKDLSQQIQLIAKKTNLPRQQLRAALEWIDFLEHKNKRLAKLYLIPELWLGSPPLSRVERVHRQGVFMPPGMMAMWEHCQLYFSTQSPGWRAEVEYAYLSPAYQAFLWARAQGNLEQVLQRKTAVHYSRHHQSIPDLRINLQFTQQQSPKKSPWKKFGQTCTPFGFSLIKDATAGQTRTLRFPGLFPLYEKELANQRIPKSLRKDVQQALKENRFYPSPKALKIIFALAEQESSYQWNPRVGNQKKKVLLEKFEEILLRTEEGFVGNISSFFLPDQVNQRKRELVEKLRTLTDPKKRDVYEYDIYLWSQEMATFSQSLVEQYQSMAKLGQWLFRIEDQLRRLTYEPKTFGLWQINVNHLMQRIAKKPRLREQFPQLYQRQGTVWLLDRHALVQSLRGLTQAPLSRFQSLRLIFQIYLQPRYQNHLRGEEQDLSFFAAENLGGEMSTYRAAIQWVLNDQYQAKLIVDGDLAHYFPYSLRINWQKTSNTQKILHHFIRGNPGLFRQSPRSRQLLQTLCEADSWKKLKSSELYQKLMQKQRGVRVFPQVESELYHQSPKTYAEKVFKRAKLIFL